MPKVGRSGRRFTGRSAASRRPYTDSGLPPSDINGVKYAVAEAKLRRAPLLVLGGPPEDVAGACLADRPKGGPASSRFVQSLLCKLERLAYAIGKPCIDALPEAPNPHVADNESFFTEAEGV